MLTSLFSLFYVTRESYRFLHRGKPHFLHSSRNFRKTLFTFPDKELREICVDACLFSIIIHRLGWRAIRVIACECFGSCIWFFWRIRAVSWNKSIRQLFWLLVFVPSDHLLLTYFLMSYLFWLHFWRCAVSHVNQSRAVSTFEDWSSHGKAWHVLWWSVSDWIAMSSVVHLSK